MSDKGLHASPWAQRSEPPPSLGRRAVSALLCLIGVAILVFLGCWQLQRLHWKEDLLARIAALRTAPARPVESILKGGGDMDFVRVRLDCPDLEHHPLLRMFGVRGGVAGYRLIAACPVAGGPYTSILVDRGFVPLEQADAAMRPGRAGLPGPIIGLLRKGDKPTFVTPANRVAANLWYWRDIPAMAKQLDAPAPAPVFLMLEQPAALAGGPIPAPVPIDIPNRHLEYAITWFGLAVALVGVYVASLFRKRRT